nr:hypothetical protein [Tanacetum cinerariifolium]
MLAHMATKGNLGEFNDDQGAGQHDEEEDEKSLSVVDMASVTSEVVFEDAVVKVEDAPPELPEVLWMLSHLQSNLVLGVGDFSVINGHLGNDDLLETNEISCSAWIRVREVWSAH